jgi:hypothetical protein
MGGQRTGLSAKVRAYVAQHPNATASDIRAAVGGDSRELLRELCRLTRIGGLVAERGGERIHYLPGSAPWDKARKERKPKSPKSKPLSIRPSIEPKAKPDIPRGQSVDDFLANGGRVEVLPTHWDEYRVYPRMPVGRYG